MNHESNKHNNNTKNKQRYTKMTNKTTSYLDDKITYKHKRKNKSIVKTAYLNKIR